MSFLSPTHYDFSNIPTVLRDLKKFLMHTIMSDPDNSLEMVNSEYRQLDHSFITVSRILSDNSVKDKETALCNLIKFNTLELEYIHLQNLKIIVKRTLIELHKIKKQRYQHHQNSNEVTYAPTVRV